MNKRLKVYISTGILILGLQTLNVYNYSKHGLLPFRTNKYDGYKVTMSNEEKSISFYSTKNMKMMRY